MSLPPVWDPLTIEGIIELWQLHPCLYDTNSLYYHDREARRTALEDILTRLSLDASGITVEQLKAKLKNLRTQYVKVKTLEYERRKRGIKAPRWRYTIPLSFLEPHTTVRSSKSDSANPDDGGVSIKLEEDDDEETGDLTLDIYEGGDDSNQNDSLVDMDDDDSVVSSVSTPVATLPPTTVTTATTTTPAPTARPAVVREEPVRPPKRPRTETFENEMIKKGIESLEKAYKRFTREPGKKTEDELDVFGKHVANELREISSPNARRFAKLQIQQILYSSQVEGSIGLPGTSASLDGVKVQHHS